MTPRPFAVSTVLWPLLGMSLIQATTMLAVVTIPVIAPVLSADLGEYRKDNRPFFVRAFSGDSILNSRIAQLGKLSPELRPCWLTVRMTRAVYRVAVDAIVMRNTLTAKNQ